jgi:hypothetical protein
MAVVSMWLSAPDVLVLHGRCSTTTDSRCRVPWTKTGTPSLCSCARGTRCSRYGRYFG